jgi:DNA-binding MarR family transcriptional regulator
MERLTMSDDSEIRLSGNEIGRVCACFNLRRAARLVTQRFDQAFRDLDLRATQLSVLVGVYTVPDITVSKLAEAMGMERTSLTRNLKVLERKGLVLGKEGEDKRERRISITPDGLLVLKKAFHPWQSVQTEVENTLGCEKWEALLSGLHDVARKFR